MANFTTTTIVPSTLPPPNGENISFMIMSSILLWIMVPGCGFFYSGLARSKSALIMIILSLWSIVIVSIQWFVIGYSLSFSLTSKNPIVGNFDKMFLIGVYQHEFDGAKGIPELAFCYYQGVTASLPTALIMGALAERARLLPALVFILIWVTFVYNPIAYWSLNPNGWSFKLGILDFGGGSAVHVPAGAAALAYSYLLGPRDNMDRLAKPHNMINLIIGTVLIWFGSFGYNAGSANGPSMQALMSCFITNLSGSVGALTWSLLDYFHEKKCSAFGLCAGGVVGLIAVTPSSGFISPASSIVFGMAASSLCRWCHFIKLRLHMDDALDVFAMHGFAGIVGITLTGIFAQQSYAENEVTHGGWLDGNWLQIIWQLTDLVAGFTWSFIISSLVLFLMNKTSFLRLRLESHEEILGADASEMGITCYEHIEDLKVDYFQYSPRSVSAKTKSFNQELITVKSNNGIDQDINVANNGGAGQPQNVRSDWRKYWD